jgi:hypothetical protein
MRRISTGIEQLLTADDVAEAVLTYAGVLARANTADTIEIPIVLPDGSIDRARLLLGPASQLTIVPDGDAEDVDLEGAEAVVEDLERRTARLEPGPADAEASTNDPDLAFPDLGEHR